MTMAMAMAMAITILIIIIIIIIIFIETVKPFQLHKTDIYTMNSIYKLYQSYEETTTTKTMEVWSRHEITHHGPAHKRMLPRQQT